MVVGANDNIDGDFPNNTSYFTGGYHGYMSRSSGNYTATMREVSKEVYADGRPLLMGESCYCDSVVIKVVNLLQGCNTEKADGSGREIVKQTILVICNNEGHHVSVNLEPLENISIYLMSGLCIYNDLPYVQFIGSQTATGIYGHSEVVRADRCVHTIAQFDNNYQIDLSLDTSFGVGNGQYNSMTRNASIESAGKSYFYLVKNDSGQVFSPSDIVTFRGIYKLKSR